MCFRLIAETDARSVGDSHRSCDSLFCALLPLFYVADPEFYNGRGAKGAEGWGLGGGCEPVPPPKKKMNFT